MKKRTKKGKSTFDFIVALAAKEDEDLPFLDESEVKLVRDPENIWGTDLYPGKYKNIRFPYEQEGSVFQFAFNNIKAFITGDNIYPDDPFNPRMPQNRPLVGFLMDNYVMANPEKYFEWKLNRKHHLRPWLYPAAHKFIERDPVKALEDGVHEHHGVEPLLPDLWMGVISKRFAETGEKDPARVFRGRLQSLMRRLSGLIANNHPEFYKENVYKDDVLTHKQHDRNFERNYYYARKK